MSGVEPSHCDKENRPSVPKYNMVGRIFNFTNTYCPEAYEGFEVIDLSSLSGTDMYCDDRARETISESFEGEPGGLHLIDSGNYHYMTRLFTAKIAEPYELIYFDNHTDMKPAMFDMLSCGSWAKESLERDENLKRLYMVGPPEKSIGELPEKIKNNDKLVIITAEELEEDYGGALRRLLKQREGSGKIPLYISIDKDILSKDEVLTNWDQGSLLMEDLCDMLKTISRDSKILGTDICGLMPASQPEGPDAYEKGLKTDLELCQIFCLKSLKTE